jgi:hypothetical protein
MDVAMALGRHPTIASAQQAQPISKMLLRHKSQVIAQELCPTLLVLWMSSKVTVKLEQLLQARVVSQ